LRGCVPEGHRPRRILRVYQESALRAIIECQPYNLPAAYSTNGNILRRCLPNERREDDLLSAIADMKQSS